MRLYFPESLRDITKSLPSPSPNQTGVGTATPLLRNVVREMYFLPRSSEGMAPVMAILYGKELQHAPAMAGGMDTCSRPLIARNPIDMLQA